ncbi:RDD family protein [Pseudomonas sp. CGJS7]|uniref:RDD family protein n=1 Tax=Pseudomonas sp. CGJS7 TaxID=3109348 RepID=UPI00300B2AF3
MSSPARSAPAAAAWVPAGLWVRYLAWSLDAALIAASTTLIGAAHWRRLAAAAGEAYAAMNARVAEVMSGAVLDDLDFGGFSQQLLADPGVHAAAASTAGALTSLILGWTFLYALLGLVYEVGFVAFSSWRATPGKRALGVWVSDEAGRRLGAGRAALRYLGGGLSWLSLNIGHLMAAAKPEHRALHDRIAGARVVRAGDAQTPLWGWAWLLLQAIASLAACVWLARAMQAALDAVLLQNGAI